MAERFSESDPVEEILRMALRSHATEDASLRERLLASAAELGISEEQALAAQKDWQAKKEREEEVRAYRQHVKEEFWGHVKAYVLVNTILVFINLMVTGGRLGWAEWPLGVWGIILIVHAMVAFSQVRQPSGEEFEAFRRARKGEDPIEALIEESFASALGARTRKPKA